MFAARFWSAAATLRIARFETIGNRAAAATFIDGAHGIIALAL